MKFFLLFAQTKQDIGEWWQKQLQEFMAKAAKVEKRLAEERALPAITVIIDGGWSNRSHSHPYNAKSGMGILIGQATGKLLYIGG